MGDTVNIQKRLFKQLKEQLPAHLSLVDELAELLSISTDSVYRRIRGEKKLTLEEVQKICQQFHISMDAFIKNPSGSIPFQYISVDEDVFTVEDYLRVMAEQASTLAIYPQSEATIITNDLTIFQLLQIPELAAFKLFFWLKSSLGFEQYYDQSFSLDIVDDKMINMSHAIMNEIIGIKTTEIVGIDAVDSFLRQIAYYLESGFFTDPTEARIICGKLYELTRHFHQEADKGFKFRYGGKPAGKAGNFTMYYNELFIIDGVVLTQSGEQVRSYIATGPLNYLASTDKEFYDHKMKWAQNLMKRSVLLSGVSEKARNGYFLQTQRRILDFMKGLS